MPVQVQLQVTGLCLSKSISSLTRLKSRWVLALTCVSCCCMSFLFTFRRSRSTGAIMSGVSGFHADIGEEIKFGLVQFVFFL